jgi:predicted secreted protein
VLHATVALSLRSLFSGRRPRPDARGRKIVALIECHLNQNARDSGAARYPAVNHTVLDRIRESNSGVLQLPCPEMHCLGLARERPKGMSLREAMDTPDSRARCRDLAREVTDRIEDYVRNGVEIVAILGGDVESPGCAVHNGADGLDPSSGVFVQELAAELQSRGLDVPFRGIRESCPEAFERDLSWLSERLR